LPALGEPGRCLFEYYAELGADDATDFETLQERTFELLAGVQRGIAPGEAESAIGHFLSLYRFYSMLSDDVAVPYEKVVIDIEQFVSETMTWLVNFLTTHLIEDFKAAIAGRDSLAACHRIKALRDLLPLQIGAFVWENVVVAVDVALANLLLTGPFDGVESLQKTADEMAVVSSNAEVTLTILAESLVFVLTYGATIAGEVPFEEVAPDLPVDFMLALVVAGKRNRWIRLEISDKRILKAADAGGVDVARVDDIRLACSCGWTEIPPTLWSDRVPSAAN
jgi:hypothetical protein